MVEEPLGVEVGAELDVVLLGRDHGQVFLLLAPVLAEFHATHVLKVAQEHADMIHFVILGLFQMAQDLFRASNLSQSCF